VRKDYTAIKCTLDKALNGFRAEVGPLKHERQVRGCYVCSHVTNFPCLKQSSEDNGMKAWFAILQMREFAKDAERLLLPVGLQKKGTNMADANDRKVRAVFRRIQRDIGTILMRDVIRGGGIFNYTLAISNREIESRLAASLDERTFNTLDGVRPFPPKL
jgi:hypothetical protein